MYDADKMVIYTRDGIASGFDTVIDTYEFKQDARNGQVSRVFVSYQRGHGYRTIMFIDRKMPMERAYYDWQWIEAKHDLEDVLLQHQCDLFTIRDPKRA